MSHNVEKKLHSFKEIEIEPSVQLINKTKLMAKVASEQRKKRRKINWVPTILTASLAVIALFFAVLTFVNLNSSPSMISSETAAIYSLDINPSIEFGVDSKKEVIEVKSLNEDGKILLKEVNCIGLSVNDCIDQLIKKAVEFGYIDEEDANYVIVSEILLKDDYDSMKTEIDDLEKPDSIKFVFLVGDINNKESADSKGISTGKEIFQEKAKEIGIDIKDSDLVEMSIKEVLNTTKENASLIFDEPIEYEKPMVSTESVEGYITVNWTKIADGHLTGYKIIVSKNNATPAYPDDGYLVYITDVNQNSYIIDNHIQYTDGDFGGYLLDQESYFISVTALYDNGKAAGNAVETTFINEKIVATPSPTPVVVPSPTPVPTPAPTPVVYNSSNITGERLANGSIVLNWDKINSEYFVGYKVVASKSNPNPSYPNDGYIKYVTDKSITSIVIDNEFSSKLEKGEEYYFSITVLYDGVKIPGNAVLLKYMDKVITPPAPIDSSSTITGERLSDGSIILGWSKIESDNFAGYKVVASATNPNPSYPNDGYIRYITDRNTTSLVVDSSFASTLTPGIEYYFSITVLYNDNKVAGNAIKLQYLDQQAIISQDASTITGQRLTDGSILLNWDKIDTTGFSGYKVVASANNPNPSYPTDGYIKYITDKNTTSLLVDASYTSKLTAGTSYYFSITVLYGSNKVAGNAVQLTYLNEGTSSIQDSSTITGQRLTDGSILLNWDKIDTAGFSGYKVVASASNPNPSYPTDGYIKYITDNNTTSLLVDTSYISKLTPGTSYYFSITVLYGDNKVAGNSTYLQYLDTSVTNDTISSTITGQRLSDGSILLNWDKIDEVGFSGYKVVASSSNPNPVYPTDGYIEYISDKNTTSLVVDASYASKLIPGTSYYFSITVLYGDEKVAGNAIYLQYRDVDTTSTYPATSITGQRLEDGSILLNWDIIDEVGFEGYKVVASATNSNPTYATDGYIKWITDKNTNSLLVDSSFSSTLIEGVSYYFSITVLYNSHSVQSAGNAVYLLFK